MKNTQAYRRFRGFFSVSRFRNWPLYGAISGPGAVVFTFGIELCSDLVSGGISNYIMPEPGPGMADATVAIEPAKHWLFFFIPAIGGLVVGWSVFKFAPVLPLREHFGILQ